MECERYLHFEVLLTYLVIAVVTRGETAIRQVSSCRAVVNDFVYNLEPLMRTDGQPRFLVEDDAGLWNYSFSPCESFNLPADPHEGEGDQCQYVAVCQWRRTTSSGEYYSIGIQRNARFVLQRYSGTKSFQHDRNSIKNGNGSNSAANSLDLIASRNVTTLEVVSTFNSTDGGTGIALSDNVPGTGTGTDTPGALLNYGNSSTNSTIRTNSGSIQAESEVESVKSNHTRQEQVEERARASPGSSSSVFSSTPSTMTDNSNANGQQNVEVGEPRPSSHAADDEKGRTTTRPVDDSRNMDTNGETDYHIQNSNNNAVYQKRIPAILFKGIRTKLKRRVIIYLVCDYSRVSASDALFIKINDQSEDKQFELIHRCCCPNGCTNNSIVENSLQDSRLHVHQSASLTTGGSRGTNRSDSVPELAVADDSKSPLHGSQLGTGSGETQDKGPKYIWLLLVINGGILVAAVFVAGVCCKKGGVSFVSTGSYGYVPTAIHASRLTMDSTDFDGRYVSVMKLASPDYRDYGSAAQISRAPVLDNCVIPSHQLDIGQRLGGGLFSDTYLAEWKKRRVAAKRITVRVHQNQLTEADSAWIANEVYRLSYQRHRNLVAVLGICIETRQPYVITELIEGDSLKEKIVKMEIEQINWYHRLKLCLQVADGMAFLHSAKAPVLHRDLRCANILIDQYGKAKIVDFGLTRIVQRLRNECDHGSGCYCQKEHSAFPASVRWTAPEVLRCPVTEEGDSAVFSPACDVYSFAMVCWEIASYRDPFDDSTEEQVIELVVQGGRPPVDSLMNTMSSFRDFMKACWVQNPEQRPNFKQIAVTLKAIQQVAGRFSSQTRRKRTNSDSTTNYLRSALNILET